MFDNMTDNYIKQINDLREWYKSQLKGTPVLKITREKYQGGIDDFPEMYQAMSRKASDKWEKERGYGLSYNQSCQAMAGALRDLGLLEIVG